MIVVHDSIEKKKKCLIFFKIIPAFVIYSDCYKEDFKEFININIVT